MMDVLIVDDHPVIRELFRQLVETHPDLSVAAEVTSGEDAIAQATILQPSIALVDVHLPTISGIETTKCIKAKSPCTVIIGLTAGEPNDQDKAMIAAGASAVINKADAVHCLYPLIIEAARSMKTAT